MAKKQREFVFVFRGRNERQSVRRFTFFSLEESTPPEPPTTNRTRGHSSNDDRERKILRLKLLVPCSRQETIKLLQLQTCPTMSTSNASADDEVKETNWTDDAVRWTAEENEHFGGGGCGGDEDDDDEGVADIFKEDPRTSFSFQFEHPEERSRSIDIELQGFKYDSDEIYKSTGLTLWRAASKTCDYILQHHSILQGKRILELGAGLGLCGILARAITTGDSHICITDGDTNVLVVLRQNIIANQSNYPTSSSDRVKCHQLLWGKETAEVFLEVHGQEKRYDVLLASDIIYSPVVVQPLWETVQTLLSSDGGIFVMAFARRRVPVTVESVLQAGLDAGFVYECTEDPGDDPEGVFVYEFRWKTNGC